MGGVHLIPHHLVCIWPAAWPVGTRSERAHSAREVSQQDESQERILINNGQVVEATAVHRNKMEREPSPALYPRHTSWPLLACQRAEDRALCKGEEGQPPSPLPLKKEKQEGPGAHL